MTQTVAIFACLLYLAAVLAIGAWTAPRVRGARDFFVAGQKVGLCVTALATMSASFSGFLFLGGPGLTYRIGAASFFICSSISFTAAMLCWTLAKRLRLLSEARRVYTVADALLHRFNSRKVSAWAALAITGGCIAYLGLQLRVMALILESLLPLREILGTESSVYALGIGLAVVLFYTTAGGMLAGVYTDLLQGLIMILAAALVFFTALQTGGGLTNIFHTLSSSPQHGIAFLDPLGKVPIMTGLCFFFVFSIGTLGQPHLVHKFLMLDQPRKLKWMPLTLALSQSLVVLIWIGIGLTVPALVAQGRLAPLTQPDDATPVFLSHFAPEWLTGLVFAGILAAVMSTADSLINIGSAALVRDLPQALGRRPVDQLRRGRWASVAVAITAALAAYFHADLIALLGTFAFGLFAASLAPVLVVGLNWRRVTATAAWISIALGFLLGLSLEALNRFGYWPFAPGVLPSAVALASSFAILFLVTLLTPAQDVDEDIGLVMDL